jgi:uncharacterized RDD family membrane protein YckC
VSETEPPAILTVPAEARSFQGERAGIVSRVLANAIDLAILVVVLGAGYLGWSAWLFLRRGASFRFPTVTYRGTYLVGAIVLTLLVPVAWSTTGRSYGDRLLGLRVIDRRGQRMGFAAAFVRAVLCVAFPPLLFWAIVNRRSVQDLVLRTAVIYDWAEQPSSVAPSDPS